MKQGLTRTAASLSRRAGRLYPDIHRRAPSGLWFLTDPARTPDPVAIAKRLPAGSVVVYRAFGQPDALARAEILRRLTRRRGLLLLIGADAALARKVGADGVHLPQRLAYQARRLRRAHPHWLVTAAAPNLPALPKAERCGAQVVLISAVFPSRSVSARAPRGIVRFHSLVARARGPVVALGGVNGRTAPRLRTSQTAGLAAVEALSAL